MSINGNLAYPYVKAIFEIAVEKNNLSTWEKVLKLWAITVQTSPKLFSTNHMANKQKQWEILLSVGPLAHIEIFETATNLLKILIAKKQLLLLPKIAALYQKLCAKHRQMLILKVVCATELSEQQKQALKNSLETKLNSQTQINYSVDESLIGGVKIYFDDQVMDISINGQLQRLKEILN